MNMFSPKFLICQEQRERTDTSQIQLEKATANEESQLVTEATPPHDKIYKRPTGRPETQVTGSQEDGQQGT